MITNKVRVYIKPYNDDGSYASSWIEITDDVLKESLTQIAQDLDNTEYNIGVYRSNNLSLTLRNDHGRYSDVGQIESIFRYKRTDSLCKVTWALNDEGPQCGAAICGEAVTNEEVTIFTGLINDESLSMNLDTQQVTFYVLGRESLLSKCIVPYADIANGDLISEIIYACLNQEPITDTLTVNLSNINLGLDVAVDDVSSLENKTVRDAINNLMLISNSVLKIEDDEIIVSDRNPTASVQYNFFGQASEIGQENIVNILNIKNGLSRMFNFLQWKDTAVVSSDSSSIDHYGVRKKEFESDVITDNSKRENLLDLILSFFKDPKQEFELITPLNYETVDLKLNDRVDIDYPTVYTPGEAELPAYGVAVYGQAVYPTALWSFTLDTTRNFKIIGRVLEPVKALIKFKLREI